MSPSPLLAHPEHSFSLFQNSLSTSSFPKNHSHSHSQKFLPSSIPSQNKNQSELPFLSLSRTRSHCIWPSSRPAVVGVATSTAVVVGTVTARLSVSLPSATGRGDVDKTCGVGRWKDLKKEKGIGLLLNGKRRRHVCILRLRAGGLSQSALRVIQSGQSRKTVSGRVQCVRYGKGDCFELSVASDDKGEGHENKMLALRRRSRLSSS
ncbi:hypothetical protein AAHA92_27720 [Salvia divinorum]|uniref:Uncharacterized protein n=1 Tax=Salvia divinorum TaxID=28513 RepID=A0ABD1G4K5_SALDI